MYFFFSALQIIILLGKRNSDGAVQLVGVLGHESGVDGNLWGSKGRGGNKLEGGVTNQLAGEPEEGLLEVVVGLGRDIVVLERLLAVEVNVFGLDLALLDIDLVTAENNGDVLADTDEIAVPVGNVLVGNAGGQIEHDDTALSVDAIRRRKHRLTLVP